MEFDHRNPEENDHSVSRGLRTYPTGRIFRELEKCDVVCALCHRRRTAIRDPWADIRDDSFLFKLIQSVPPKLSKEQVYPRLLALARLQRKTRQMYLSQHSLCWRHKELLREPDQTGEFTPPGLDPDSTLINQASIDIRVGHGIIVETGPNEWSKIDLRQGPYSLTPGTFALVPTFEYFQVPNDLACELKLKSSIARLGWNHALAFHVDPGWRGILTMEVMNALKHTSLELRWKMKFAQVIYHPLDQVVQTPYNGKYQGALEAQRSQE